jgi:hypothetical protein
MFSIIIKKTCKKSVAESSYYELKILLLHGLSIYEWFRPSSTVCKQACASWGGRKSADSSTDKSFHSLLLSDLLSNRRLRNFYFSVTLKNMNHLHFSRKKVQLHVSIRNVQLVAVAPFLNYGCTFLNWLRNKNFSGNWDIGKPFFFF